MRRPKPFTRDEMRHRMAAVVLFHVPDDTSIPKARELAEHLTDLALEAVEELAAWTPDSARPSDA